MSEPRHLPPPCQHNFKDEYGLQMSICEKCRCYGYQCAACGKWMADRDTMWCTCLFYGLVGHPDSWRYCSDICVMKKHPLGWRFVLPGSDSFMRDILAKQTEKGERRATREEEEKGWEDEEEE